MDKVIAHRETVKRLIAAHAALTNRSAAEETSFAAFDDERGLYLLVRAGWVDGRRVRGTTLFVRLVRGKIWVEEDGTEDGLAYELVAAGIPREDIVLGFQPPRARPQTEFAVA